MKKLRLILLILLAGLLGVQLVTASETPAEFAGARFLVNEILDTNELPFGVKHTKIDGFTSTSLSGYDADGLGGSSASVVPGKYYEQKVNVLEVPSLQGVKITTWANLNNSKWTLTTVKKLIANFESNNPGWEVVGAINGDFFDINAKKNFPYTTTGALVSNGEFYKTTTSRMIGFANDGSTDSLIGNKTAKRTEYMRLAVYDKNDKVMLEFNVEKMNAAPEAGESAVYFANYDEAHNLIPLNFTASSEASVFVVDNAELALPVAANDFYGRGVISSLAPRQLQRGQFAIVTNNNMAKAVLKPGVKIRCQFEFVGDYAAATDITGCGATIYYDNVMNASAGMKDRAPRTVIGKKADGTIVMMVIDGRQSPKGMYGADATELAVIMKNFGCVDAYNLDGGGSSTMIIKKNGQFVVLNSPSDGFERSDSNCLLIATKTPDIQYDFSQIGDAININVNVLDEAGHDMTELYVEFGGRLKKIASSETTISDFKSNTNYSYVFKYRDRYGKLITLPYSGGFQTLKSPPDIYGAEVFETDNMFIISLLYDDPDHSSSLDEAHIIINGKEISCFDGEASAQKDIVGNRLDSFEISYHVNVNDGDKTFTYTFNAFILKTSIEIDTLFAIMEELDNTILNIYK